MVGVRDRRPPSVSRRRPLRATVKAPPRTRRTPPRSFRHVCAEPQGRRVASPAERLRCGRRSFRALEVHPDHHRRTRRRLPGRRGDGVSQASSSGAKWVRSVRSSGGISTADAKPRPPSSRASPSRRGATIAAPTRPAPSQCVENSTRLASRAGSAPGRVGAIRSAMRTLSGFRPTACHPTWRFRRAW